MRRDTTWAPILTMLLVLAIHTPTWAEDQPEAAMAEPTLLENVSIEPACVVALVTPGPEGLRVEGRFAVAASTATAWEVLTDYDGIPRFVSSMKASHTVERNDGAVVVEQEAVGRLLFFRRRLHTTLHVQESPMSSIRFEDVLHKDFIRYRGEWRIVEHGRSVDVLYQVVARPASAIPDFVARPLFQRAVRQLLTEIEKEIEHRAATTERLPTERSRP